MRVSYLQKRHRAVHVPDRHQLAAHLDVALHRDRAEGSVSYLISHTGRVRHGTADRAHHAYTEAFIGYRVLSQFTPLGSISLDNSTLFGLEMANKRRKQMVLFVLHFVRIHAKLGVGRKLNMYRFFVFLAVGPGEVRRAGGTPDLNPTKLKLPLLMLKNSGAL